MRSTTPHSGGPDRARSSRAAGTGRSGRLKQLLLYAVVTLFLLAVLFPLFWMTSIAFKTNEEAIAFPPALLPRSLYTENFAQILSDLTFMRFFLNSFIVASVGTIVSTMSSAIAGFVFAKYEFYGKKLLFFLLLATIMIPFQTYMVSLYVIVLSLKLVNTYAGLVFPIIISSFGIFFMRQNMQGIPDELLDAARIDGASNMRIFLTVIVPLSTSAIAVLAVFQFLNAWNTFIWPLLVTNSKKLYVVELGLSLFQNEFYVDYGVLMAGSTLAVLPVLAVYMILRRYVLEGIALTGLKS